MNIHCSCMHACMICGGLQRSAGIVAVLGLLTLLSSTAFAAETAAARVVTSPDGKISLAIHTDSPLGYSITVDGKPVLLRSRLGLELAGDVKLGEKLIALAEERRVSDQHWENKYGKNSDVRDHYNELDLLVLGGERRFLINARAYDDGVAFRYVLPKQDGMDAFVVMRDATEFVFADDHQVWAGWNVAASNIPEGGFIGSQEWRFLPNKLSGLNPNFKYGMPFLVQTPAAYVAITEADLLDWSGMWLAPKAGAANTLETHLAPPREQGKAGLVETATPHNSPWRTFLIARQPHELIQSDLVLNLSTPSKIADTSWIKPGIAAWDWWVGTSQMNTASLKQFIDLAADMNWPYMLIDAGWSQGSILQVRPQVDLPELVRYAKEKNVRLWLWTHWTTINNNDMYKQAFPLYEKWGIAGVKIDFMDRDDQWMVNWYEKIAQAAAESHLMVNFHGAHKPAGLNRTWPNQITREGIQGNEYNKFGGDKVSPEHKATLPFTRVLAGPADYTPGGFLNRQPSQFRQSNSNPMVQGTRANELAMFILIESPVANACDSPAHYKDQNGNYKPGMDFLKGLPTVWDETKGLAGEVGKYVVEARRNGKNWYLAAICDRNARELSVPLKFLGEGNWKAMLWEDAPDSDQNAENVVKNEKYLRSSDTLQLKLAPSGGVVAILTPEK
jgi:alpha-glucosidase